MSAVCHPNQKFPDSRILRRFYQSVENLVGNEKIPSCSGYIGLRLVQPWREGWIFERGFFFHNRIRHNASSQGKLKHRRPGQMSKMLSFSLRNKWRDPLSNWLVVEHLQERSLLEISLSNLCRFCFWVSRGMLYSWCWHVPLNMCPSAVVYIRLAYVRFEKNTFCNFCALFRLLIYAYSELFFLLHHLSSTFK